MARLVLSVALLCQLALTTAWGGYGLPSGSYSWPPRVHPQVTPSYHFKSFSYPSSTTTRTATSNPSIPLTTYAVPYKSVHTLFANVSSTTWANWTPSPSPTSPTTTGYGQAGLDELWNAANPTNFTRGQYSTVVSPTPVPKTELIYPPPLYFQPDTAYHFPADFIYGAAGSASQCEGAIADAGKSPTFLDMIATIFGLVGKGFAGALGGGSGAIDSNYIANEHFYLYKQDIERLASIGLKHYSFSIPWSRVFPFALPGTPANTAAIQHYSDVIDFVLAKGMQPIVTLHHFDTPLVFYGGGHEYLEQYVATKITYGAGYNWGFANATFEDAYVHYAQFVMSHYADRVPMWFTINEPQIGTANGVAVNTVLKAHARVVHFYREVLKGKGKVSIKMGVTPAVPQDATNQSHVAAAEFFSDLYVGTFMNPLALGVDYPQAFKEAVADYVPLTKADLQYLGGTVDFVALDAYSAPVVRPATSDLSACARDTDTATNPYRAFPICIDAVLDTPTNWSIGYDPAGSTFNLFEPTGLRTQLNYAWNTYRKPVLISELGLQVPVPQGGLDNNLFNVPSSEYLLGYLNEALKAIWEDGVHVLGALTWNWGDDWEFGTFDGGFGLQYINHTSQERKYRRSFFDVIDFVEGRRRK